MRARCRSRPSWPSATRTPTSSKPRGPRPAHQRLHQLLRPPSQRPHRRARRRQGRHRVVPADPGRQRWLHPVWPRRGRQGRRPQFAAGEIADAIDAVIDTFQQQRQAGERFIDACSAWATSPSRPPPTPCARPPPRFKHEVHRPPRPAHWQHAIGEDGPKPTPIPAPHRLLSWSNGIAVRAHWPQDLPVAIEFPNDADISQLAPDLPHCAGRPRLPQVDRWPRLSQAHVLRARFKFKRRHPRARRSVGRHDAVAAAHGFNEVVLRGDQSQTFAQKALDLFNDVGFYQGDVAGDAAWFLRSAAA